MQTRSTSFLFLLIFLTFLLPPCTFAGELDTFEADATKDRDARSEKPNRGASDIDKYELIEDNNWFGELLSAIIQAAGDVSFAREGYPHRLETVPLRQAGDRLLPRLRLDVSGQLLEHDIDAFDIRGEGGFGAVAGQVRHTRMREEGTGDVLKATYGHLLLRFALGAAGEMDFGLGAFNLEGNNSTTGPSLTLPIQVHGKNFGIEARPAWSNLNGNTIQDYDVAVVTGVQFVALRAGYRWLMAPHETLQGPYAGASLSW